MTPSSTHLCLNATNSARERGSKQRHIRIHSSRVSNVQQPGDKHRLRDGVDGDAEAAERRQEGERVLGRSAVEGCHGVAEGGHLAAGCSDGCLDARDVGDARLDGGYLVLLAL